MFHETPKSSIEQSFKAGYTVKFDAIIMFHGTKFHHVAWAEQAFDARKKSVFEVCGEVLFFYYSKTCLKRSLKIDQTKILMTKGGLMKVKSIAAFCKIFDLH